MGRGLASPCPFLDALADSLEQVKYTGLGAGGLGIPSSLLLGAMLESMLSAAALITPSPLCLRVGSPSPMVLCADSPCPMVLGPGFSFAYCSAREYSFGMCLCVGSPPPMALLVSTPSPLCLSVGSSLVRAVAQLPLALWLLRVVGQRVLGRDLLRSVRGLFLCRDTVLMCLSAV